MNTTMPVFHTSRTNHLQIDHLQTDHLQIDHLQIDQLQIDHLQIDHRPIDQGQPTSSTYSALLQTSESNRCQAFLQALK
ncbi:MAG: hypothetical protein ABJF11_06895, partial [Reichenbachiella sp.]|uniref:hypothetical protein n=1 Tax=Reichenbachiella sp. TaxID=2184521 RepID=UPI003263929F